MTKKQEAEIVSLNERLTAAGRSLCAHREWFFCATVLREAPAPFEVEGTGMSVMTVGRHRAAGGACLVHVEGKPCGEPVLLDDLCETWGRDPRVRHPLGRGLPPESAGPRTPGGLVKTVQELSAGEARKLLEDVQDAYRSALCYDRPYPAIAEAVNDILGKAGPDVSPLEEPGPDVLTTMPEDRLRSLLREIVADVRAGINMESSEGVADMVIGTLRKAGIITMAPVEEDEN